MKIKRLIKILIIALISICIGSTASNAAIEVKKSFISDKHSNIKADTAFDYCYNMRAYSSSLGANSLDPHLSLSADWGAAVYLGSSGYGYIRDIDGNTVTINGNSFNSTTKNATGVMNLTHTTFVSTMHKYGPTTTTNTNFAKKIRDNVNSKYVEVVNDISNISDSKGMAMTETNDWYGSRTPGTISGSTSLFYRYGGTSFGYDVTSGNSIYGYTYRPVIWN